MKRLTRKLLPYAPFGWVGGVYFAETPLDKCPKTFCKNGAKCDRNEDRTCPFLAALDRLAEYEDTGLMPDEIEKLKSPRWMPCAEGLPEPRHKGQQRQAYLVSLETGCVSMMFYEFNPNGYLGEGWTDKIIGVIAWRELPEPYNPDRKEDAKSDDVSQWPDWKKRAALSNYELGKEDSE